MGHVYFLEEGLWARYPSVPQGPPLKNGVTVALSSLGSYEDQVGWYMEILSMEPATETLSEQHSSRYHCEQ